MAQPADSTTTQSPTNPDEPKRLKGVPYWVAITLGTIGLLMAINQTFNIRFMGFSPLGNSFLYYLIGLFLAAAFIAFPAHKGAENRVPWYDWLLAIAALVSTVYIGIHGLQIIQEGWDFMAPTEATVASAVVLALILEGVRRCGGWPLLAVALFFGSYPLFAGYMPGFLFGTQFDLGETIRSHVMGVESIIGIPMQVVARLVIGFVVFGAALTVTGGGDFFMRFATSLMGRTRGGPAKVSVVSSGFMGSLSGSVISNILTTGPITIPTMKRSGLPAALRRRCGGLRLHWRYADAARHGGSRLHHGLVPRRALRGSDDRRLPASAAVLHRAAVPGGQLRRQAWPQGSARFGDPRPVGDAQGRLAISVQPGHADLHAAVHAARGPCALLRHPGAAVHLAVQAQVPPSTSAAPSSCLPR
jgi:hypothetical protein